MATAVDAGLPEGFVLDQVGDPGALPEGFVLDQPRALADAGEQAVRRTSKGIVRAVTAPYEGLRYLLDEGISIPGIGSASPRIKLPAAEDMPLYRPFLRQPEPQTTAGRYAGAAGEAIGSTAVPAAGLLSKARQLSAVAPAVPSLGDKFLRPIAQQPGVATAIDATAATGAGLASQGVEDAGGGPGAQAAAGFVGGFAAPIAAIGAAKGLYRAAEAIVDRLPKILASADGGGMPPSAVRERAIQMIADRLTQAGIAPDELDRRIANLDWARTFHTSGKAPDVMTLADIDEGVARLLGSAVRQQPEAAATARGFLHARQTGLEPEAPLHAGAGLPTREAMDLPIKGSEAKKLFGTDFGAGDNNPVAMGNHERIVEGLRRAFRIQDSDFHGHAANANRTDEQIIAAGKALSKPAYEDAYAAGQGVDLRPHLAPVLKKWEAIAARDGNEPRKVQNLLTALIKRFSNARNIIQFDKNKQFELDAQIDRAFQSVEGRNRYVGGRLTEFKDDLLAAVDGVADNSLGAKYADARDIFSSHAEARRVLRIGREAFRDESDIGIDAFSGLTGRGDQKLFRLGYLGEVEKRSASMPDGANRAKLFENPRQRTLLAHIVERTETPTGRVRMEGGEPTTFSDRPQRFGGYLEDEGRMARTREIVSGNSKTAERLADDEAFDTLHTFAEIFKDARLMAIGKRGLEFAINKSFGMRADTSAELAKMLLTAEPRRRQQIFQEVRARMGSTRFQRFSELMGDYQRQSLTGTGGGVASGEAPRPSEDAVKFLREHGSNADVRRQFEDKYGVSVDPYLR